MRKSIFTLDSLLVVGFIVIVLMAPKNLWGNELCILNKQTYNETNHLNDEIPTYITCTWTGSTSTDWNDCTNWNNGIIPGPTSDITIPIVAKKPIIDSIAECHNITIDTDAMLTIMGSNILKVKGNWLNNGILVPNSSTIIFDGADQSIGTSSFKNLTIGGSGMKTVDVGTVQVTGVLSIEGTAYLSSSISYTPETILQYNCTLPRTIGIEWPPILSTLYSIAGVVIKNSGVISLGVTRKLETTPLTIMEGATLDLNRFTFTTSGNLNLQCGSENTAGSLITGTGLLSVNSNVTVVRSKIGTAPAIIDCPISTFSNTFIIKDESPDETTAADLLVNTIDSKSVKKTGNGTMGIKGNGIFTSLTINEGNFILQPTASLKIGGALTNTSNNALILLSDDNNTGSLIVFGSVSGKATLTRAMKSEAYHLVASPLVGQTIKDFLEKNATIQSGKAYQDPQGNYYDYTDFRNMRDYNPISNKWNEFFKTSTSSDLGSLIPGKGYSLQVRNGLANQVVFTGNLRSGDIIISGLEAGFWNCIGNPYTSAININISEIGGNNFLNANAGINGNIDPAYGIYVWDPTISTTQYQAVSNATELSNRLQVGQAFMVKMAVGKTSVIFNKYMQTHDVSLALKSTDNIWPTIQLQATANDVNSATTIAFHEGMTNGLDVTYDAGLLKADSPIDLYTRLVDDYGIPFAIQALPSDQYDQLIIPVGVDYTAGGAVSFSAKAMYLPSSCRPILEDRLTGIVTDLSDKTYTVDLDANTAGTGRFYLHTSYVSTEVENYNTKQFFTAMFVNYNQLKIQGEPITNATLTLKDALGRLIISRQIKKVDGNTIHIPTLKRGIYLLFIKDSEMTQSLKLAYSY